MDEKTAHISGISCGHCVMAISREVGELEGVSSVEGDEKTKKVTFRWENPASWKKITDTLKELGYPADA